ncbi:MAG: 50S ribosomal protein L10, partial [Nitrospinota bacterium]
NVEQMTDLRRRLQEVGAEFKVVKNTLARLALRDTPLESIDPYLKGPISIALGYEDSPAPTKVIMDYLKTQPLPEVKVGFFQGKLLRPEEVRAVAELPPREVLLAQLLGGLEAPVAALPRMLGGIMRKLLFTFQAIAEKKERSS